MERYFKGAELLKGSLPSNGVVGLFFSGHWCGPCRKFTPELAEAYKDIRAAEAKPFEIVYISSDNDQAQFDSSFAEMPWLALPYESEMRNRITKRFKVNCFPTLLLLDAKSGNIITRKGRDIISKDPKGEQYPWPPPSPLEVLGSTFVGEGKDTSIKDKYVGIYFSAKFCVSHYHTPRLAETYTKLKAAGKPFEMIFCSADHEQKDFDEYFGSMPWLAVPYEDRERARNLNEVV
jgi:nucleoredoxin